MGLGAYLTVGFALVWLIRDQSAWYYLPAWVAVMPVGFMLAFGILRNEVKTRRARAGVPTVEIPQPKSLGGVALRMLASAAPVLVAAALIELVDIEECADRVAVYAAAWGLFWVIHGLYVPAWEEIAYGIIVAAAIRAITLTEPQIRLELALCVGSAGMVLAGTVKHVRWRRWIRTLPGPSPDQGPEAVE